MKYFFLSRFNPNYFLVQVERNLCFSQWFLIFRTVCFLGKAHHKATAKPSKENLTARWSGTWATWMGAPGAEILQIRKYLRQPHMTKLCFGNKSSLTHRDRTRESGGRLSRRKYLALHDHWLRRRKLAWGWETCDGISPSSRRLKHPSKSPWYRSCLWRAMLHKEKNHSASHRSGDLPTCAPASLCEHSTT